MEGFDRMHHIYLSISLMICSTFGFILKTLQEKLKIFIILLHKSNYLKLLVYFLKIVMMSVPIKCHQFKEVIW